MALSYCSILLTVAKYLAYLTLDLLLVDILMNLLEINMLSKSVIYMIVHPVQIGRIPTAYTQLIILKL